MLLKITRTAIFTAGFLLVFAGFSAQDLFGQGGQIDPGAVDAGGGAQNNQVQSGTTSNVSGSDGTADISEDRVEIEFSENTRNQGFVGATGANVVDTETGFVGAASEESGPAVSEDASFGGGFNNTTPIVNSSGGGGGRGGAGGGAGGTVANVVRKSIRAKMVPSFYSPRPSNQAVASRFQSRFVRQPGSISVGNGYSVRIQNRTAFVSGSVNSQMDSDRIVRQLRLEPGVYGVVNQLSISQNATQQSIIQQPIIQQPIIQQTISAPQPLAPSVTRGF